MKCVVISKHESHYPNPIEFRLGDYVSIGRQDDEFPGWIWVTTNDGNQGWAPIQYLHIEESGTKAIALRDYSARELNTRVDEYLTLHYELNGWGWVENDMKECGWVPMNTIMKDESDGKIFL